MNTSDDNKLETTIKIDDDETIVPLPSDAEILFTIAGRVQIFYISADGNVSAPSYPSTLFIFKFKSEYSVQLNLCQKLLFLHQLTHNMTTDCSLNYKYNT